MKKLNVALCAMFVLASGTILVACGDKPGDNLLEFNTGDFTINNREFIYDSNEHIFSVRHDTLNNVVVTYSLDGETFKTGAEMDLVSAGNYDIYYKVSAEGYKDYVSNAVDFIIHKLCLSIEIEDYFHAIGKLEIPNKFDYTITQGGSFLNENLDLNFAINDYDVGTAKVGNRFTINASTPNNNIDLTVTPGTLHIKGDIEVANGSGDVTAYSDIHEAIDAAQAGDTITLYRDIVVEEMIDVDKSITIDGQGKFSIIADDHADALVAARKMVNVSTAGVELRLKDITLNANNKCRVVYANAGKVIVDGATITGGCTNDSFVGGVYITNAASFEMTSGSIEGNHTAIEYAADNYFQYSADLWIGANAAGSLLIDDNGSLASITGGKIGNVFVNANEYSANNPGAFTFNGGEIENVYVEYANGYGATFNYTNGTLAHLYLSTKATGSGIEVYASRGNYQGGVEAIVNDSDIYTDMADIERQNGDVVTAYVYSADSLKAAYEVADHIVIVDDILNDGTRYVGDITLKATSRNYKFDIDLNGHRIDAELDFVNFVSAETFTDYGVDVTITDSSADKSGRLGSELAWCAVYTKGDDKIDVKLDSIYCIGSEEAVYTNGFSRGVKITGVNCKFESLDTAAYFAGNGTFTFTNCEFSGPNAYYAKSGAHILNNCKLTSTAERSEEEYWSNGANGTGSALIVDSAQNYSDEPPMVVTIVGGQFNSENAYGIEEFSTAKAGSAENCYASINILEEPAFDCALGDKVSENGLFD